MRAHEGEPLTQPTEPLRTSPSFLVFFHHKRSKIWVDILKGVFAARHGHIVIVIFVSPLSGPSPVGPCDVERGNADGDILERRGGFMETLVVLS